MRNFIVPIPTKILWSLKLRPTDPELSRWSPVLERTCVQKKISKAFSWYITEYWVISPRVNFAPIHLRTVSPSLYFAQTQWIRDIGIRPVSNLPAHNEGVSGENKTEDWIFPCYSNFTTINSSSYFLNQIFEMDFPL